MTVKDCKRCFSHTRPIRGEYSPKAHPRTKTLHIVRQVGRYIHGVSWLSLCGQPWFEEAQPMKMEGRVFVLTGAQMLELAGLCRDAWELWSRATTANADQMRLWAVWWAEYLESEHAAHFGTEEDGK